MTRHDWRRVQVPNVLARTWGETFYWRCSACGLTWSDAQRRAYTQCHPPEPTLPMVR